MAVRHNPAREAELEARWRKVREDMVAEYHLLSVTRTAEEDMVPLDPSAPDGGKAYFMMLEGVPVIAVEDNGKGLSGIIGDPMGIGDESTREFIESEPAYKGRDRYAYISTALEHWDEIRGAYDAKMREVTAEHYPKEDFEYLMFKDLVADDRSIDRAAFYAATRYMDRKELFETSEMLRGRVRDLFMADPAVAQPDGRRVALENIAVAEREIDRSFCDWHRLGGRLDWRVVNLAEFHGDVSAKDIASTAEWALHAPEYAGYRKNIPNWVKNTCEAFSVSTIKLQHIINSPLQKVSRPAAAREIKM